MLPNGRKRILVVEDDPLTQALYRRAFGRHADEFSCRCESSGEDALPFLARRRVDAAVLDWDLPGIDGLTILRAIRLHPRTAALPVLMISGREDGLSRRLALDAGASDYAAKGVGLEDFIDRLRRLVGR